jgi:FkbM family methyltransferase
MEFEIVNLKIPTNPKMCIPGINTTDNIQGGNVQTSIRNTGIWSKEETSIFVDILKKNSKNTNLNIIDVGSNTGYFSIISMSYNFNVIAIEANPVYKKYLNKSIELNNYDKDKLTYYECFASDNKDPVLFDGWSGYEGIIDKNKSVSVSTVSIDNICDNEILLIKIDVEGAEPNVFRSMKKLIENKKIKYIIFELTYIVKNNLINEQVNLLPYLLSNNFNLYEIGDERLIPITNVLNTVNNWIHEYKTNHVIHNPNLVNLSAGTNILAVFKDNEIPNINLV